MMSKSGLRIGFSLAEMMVVMLIVSIVLAAMAPIVTTRMRSQSVLKGGEAGSSDGPWYWVDPSSKSGDAFTEATRLMVGQNEAGEDDAMLILNKGDDEKDNILFKNSSGTLGRLDISNSNALVLGTATLTAGIDGMAVGFDNTITTDSAVAMGFDNSINGKSYVFGERNETKNGSPGYIVGEYNELSGSYAMALGHSNTVTADSTGTCYTFGMGNIASGHNSIAIGIGAQADTSALAIGWMAQATGEHSVAIGWNASAPKENDFVLGDSAHNVQIPGSLSVKGTDVPSDKRLKYLQGENKSGLDAIRQMKVYNFIYKKDPKKERHTGVIAQELQKILPYAVKKGSDGFLTIRIDDIVYALVNAVKQLDKSVQELTKEVKAHNQKLEEISKRLDKLENK